jgi:hypothetical protein
MVDASGNEVAGLGGAFTVQISKAAGALAAAGGDKAEIGLGFYSYNALAVEADTPGPVSLVVTGAGAVQQNLEYVVKARTAGAVSWPYQVTNSVTTLPIEGVAVWFTTDIAGANVVWRGETNVAGYAKDQNDDDPFLDPGTYFVWKQHSLFSDDDNPDTEVVT